MKSINKVFLIGNIGKIQDPMESKFGKSFTYISLATNESWKDKQGELQKRTTWVNILFSDRLATNLIKYGEKGDKVYIEGKIYNSEKDGKTEMKIQALDFILLTSKPKEEREEEIPLAF